MPPRIASLLVVFAALPGAARADERVFTHRIDNHEQFERFSVPLDDVPFTKFVIDTSDRTPYYFWTAVYPFHYHFIREVLLKRPDAKHQYKDIHDFNRQNHQGDDRHYWLGAVAFHPTRRIYTFEFQQADNPTLPMIRAVHEVLKRSFFDAGLLWRPLGADQGARRDAVVAAGIPVADPGTLDAGGNYQFLNAGAGVGRLRIVPDDADLTTLDFATDEIVVLPEVPMDIQPVAGVISCQFSTPLSHVNLRARAWGIPNMGLKDAVRRASPLAGRWVFLEAKPEAFLLREASAEEVSQAKSGRRRTAGAVRIPAADLARRGLPDLAELDAASADSVGAKAANLGALFRRKGDRWDVPPGFAVPFAHYVEFIRQNGLDARIAALLAAHASSDDRAARRAALNELRSAIRAAPHTPAFRALLLGKLKTPPYAGRGVFVRSSTNAEDLEGFNGAGLYDTVPNVRGDEAVLDAVKQVWASLWSVRAFEERAWYGIDHGACHPAVVVQVGVNATAAGVMITSNIYDARDARTVTINAKHGLGLRVVDGKRVPEQVLYDRARGTLRIISRSDDDVAVVFAEGGGVREVRTGGEPVLTADVVRRLAGAADDVEHIFAGKGPQDVEWLIADGKVQLVQSRPYVRSDASP